MTLNNLVPTSAAQDVEIRIVGHDDEKLFIEMRLECLRAVYGLQEDYCFSDNLVARSVEFFRSGEHVSVFALDKNGIPIAISSLCFVDVMPTLEHPSGKRAHLMNVYVRSKFRRRGIAKDMVSRLVGEAKLRGVTEITLDATEEGRLLYESLGFKVNDEAMRLVLR